MADGSIIIDTLLRVDGYMKNMKKLHASQTKLKGQIEETTSKIDTLEKEINDLNNSEASSPKMDRLKEQIASCDKEAESLKNQMRQLANKDISTEGFHEIYLDIKKTEKELEKLYSRKARMEQLGTGEQTKQYKSTLYDISNANERLNQLVKSAQSHIINGTATTKGINTSEYEKLSSKLSQITEKRQKYNAALDVTRAKEEQSRDTKIQKKRVEQEKLNRTLDIQNAKYEETKAKINSVGNAFSRLGAAARQNMGSRITKATESCRKGISKLSQSVSRFTKRLLNVGLSVFVFTVLTKAMTALKDRMGLLLKKNQQFSSSLAQIKGNLKTTFQSIYEAALPALNSLMSVLVKVTAVIANFTAALFGKSVKASQEAADAADNQAEAVSGVGEAAKKASEYLNGYDEMNVQASSDSSGGGGGGSSSGTTYEDLDVNSGVSDFVNRIKAAWETADFTDIGRIIGTKIRDGLNGIDWETIKTTANKVGTSLATLLNGIFETPGLFAAIGTTIAETLNTVLNGLYSFGKDFHWDSLGKGLSESVNSFFATFEFDKLGSAVHDWIAGGLTVASTFLSETDFEAIGHKIGEFLTNLNSADLAAKFADLFWKAIKAGAELVKGLFEEAPVEASLLTAFSVLTFTGIGGTIATKIGSAIATALNGPTLATKVSGAIGTIGTTLTTAFTTDLPLLFSAGTFAECATAIVAGFAGAVAAAFVGWNLGNFIYECVTGEDTDDIEWGDYLGENFHISEWGDAIKQLIIDGAKNWNPIQWIYEAITGKEHQENSGFDFYVNVVGSIDAGAKLIKDWFADKKDDVKNLIANAKDNASSVIDKFKDKWNAITSKTPNLVASAKNNSEKVLSVLKGAWEKIISRDPKLTATAENKNSGVLSTLKSSWSTIKKKTAVLTAKATNKNSSTLSKIKSAWGSIYSKTAQMTVKFVDCFTKPLKAAWNALAKAINGCISIINKIPGVNISGRVPQLAKGAVIPPNAPFLAMLGDQKNGTNIETPLNTMIEAFTAALDARNDSGNEPVINVYVGGQKITDYVIKDVKNRTISSGGKNPLLI